MNVACADNSKPEVRPNRPRILMLSTDLERGGLPLRLVRLAGYLKQHGFEPIVGCLKPPGPLSTRLSQAGIETFSCHARHAADLGCLLRLAAYIRHYQPDLIHASLFHANLAARLVGRLDRPRPIITSTVTIEIERGWHRWLESLTANGSLRHIANSVAVARHLREELGFAPQNLVVIPNGLDIAEIDQIPALDRTAQGFHPQIPLIAWAGRMDPVKDLPTFVAAVDEVHRVRPVQAVLLGDGPERPRVAAMIRRRGLDRVITMTRWSENVIGILKTSDILLFPSRSEGSPNTVIEAMLCGCAVVASDLPATRNLITSGLDGFLCRCGDPREFAIQIIRLLDDNTKRLEIIKNARASAQSRFDLQHVGHYWADLYLSLISPHQQAQYSYY